MESTRWSVLVLIVGEKELWIIPIAQIGKKRFDSFRKKKKKKSCGRLALSEHLLCARFWSKKSTCINHSVFTRSPE